MSTFTCSIEEFNEAFTKFFREIGDKSNSQESIGNMYKALTLMYLGIQNPTDEQLERAAMILECATSNAIRRGWTLETPDLSIRQ